MPATRQLLAMMALAATIGLYGAQLRGMDPPRPGELARYEKDGTLPKRLAHANAVGNHKTAPGFAYRAQRKIATAALKARGYSDKQIGKLLPRWQSAAPISYGCPSVGSPKILAICIEFTDYPATIPTNVVADWLFGPGNPSNYPYESLRSYYERASLDKLHFSGEVLGWYNAGARSAIPETMAGQEQLIKDAMTHFDNLGHDFSQYDNDGDGTIDYFIVYWCGPDTGWGGFWWAYNCQGDWGFSDQSFILDGKKLDLYTWQWDKDAAQGEPDFGNLTTLHETGHAIGLPDFYDYDDTIGPKGGLGGVDMMDAAYGNHNAFSRWILDWITPAIVAAGPATNIQLDASGWIAGTNFAAVVFPGATTNYFDEFFMIENRFRVGNDADPDYMPTDGFLVWHVDATLDDSTGTFMYDNQYTEHKLVNLVSGDGLEYIELGYGAEAGDYFTPGLSLGYPRNLAYDGAATGVIVTNIVTNGLTGTATLDLTPGQADAKAFAKAVLTERLSARPRRAAGGAVNTVLEYCGTIKGTLVPAAPVDLRTIDRVEFNMGAMNIVFPASSFAFPASRNNLKCVWGDDPANRFALTIKRDPRTGGLTFDAVNRMNTFTYSAAWYYSYMDSFTFSGDTATLRLTVGSNVFQTQVQLAGWAALLPWRLLGNTCYLPTVLVRGTK